MTNKLLLISSILFLNLLKANTELIKFPDFTADSLGTGTSINQSIFLNKVTLVDFWASWCGPCKESLPDYVALAHKYKNKNFQLIAISLDDNRTDALSFLKKIKIDLPAYLEPKPSLQSELKLEVVPISFVVSSKGHIIKKFRGYKKHHLKEIEELIESNK